MRTIAKKTLALLLVFVMTFGSAGGYVKAADSSEISGIDLSVDSLPSSGGEVTVTVHGTQLSSQKLYYRVQYATTVNATGSYTSLVKKTEILNPDSTSDTEVVFTLQISGSEDAKKFIIGVCDTKLQYTSKELLVSENVSGDNTPEAVDKTALSALITKADTEVAKTDVYTSSSLVSLQSALTDAKKVFDDDSADKNSVDAAVTSLQSALDALDALPQVDKSSLKEMIETANSKKSSDYTADSWAAMQEKLSAAQTVYETETATQDQINAAKEALSAAILALSPAQQTAAQLTGATLSASTISADGGFVTIHVEGTGLTADNWEVSCERSYDEIPGVQVGSSAGNVGTISYTATDATIPITTNGMKNAIAFDFTVSLKNDVSNKIDGLKLVQEGKTTSTATISPSSVYLASENTVIAEFDQDVSAGKDGEALKSLFYISNGTENIALGENDTVTVDGKLITITYKDALTLTSQAKLCIKEGALKLSDGKTAKEIAWFITTNATISSVALAQSVYDYHGGVVTAYLNGYNTNLIDASAVTATVTVSGSLTPDDSIPVSVEKDDSGEFTASFTVPENASANTVSYILKVYQNNSPVYGESADSRSDKIVVSVLPEGKTESDITFSAATLSSGSNKVADDTSADLVLETPSSEGSFKSEFRIYGTNLDASKTKVRVVDENGIIWPVWHITTCDGESRFVSLGGEYSNGTFGDGNSQLIEILPPKYVGTDKVYTFEVAVDGENYINTGVTLKVKNSSLSGNESFKDCTSANYKYLTVKYVDENGKDIADSVKIKGYYYSMVLGQDYKAKEITGYTLVKEPTATEDDFFCDGKTITYEYKRTSINNSTSGNDSDNNDFDNSGSGSNDTANGSGNNDTGKTVNVTGITVSAISSKLAAGKKVQFTAAVTPSNASNTAVTWSTSNKKFATVNANGKVTLKAKGAGRKVTITATAKDGSGVKGSYEITIMKNAVKSIKLEAAKSVQAGKSVTVKATVKTTGKKVNKTLKWTSSNTKYATVNSKGKVTAKKAGKGKTVKITATARDGSNKKATVKIKIK